MQNLLVAQSGGPTAAINATLAGVIREALAHPEIDEIFGALHGIKGVMAENIKPLKHLFGNPENITLLTATPASALGSCRHRLDGTPETMEKIIEVLRKNNVGYFIYIGGNDSMDTVMQLSAYCHAQGITDIKMMGAPKTIDNDLPITDHTPGFGSAAKYIAVTTAEIMRDIQVYDTPAVTILEMMGRNTGWLAASAALAGLNGGTAPHLIYLPEVPFDDDAFINDTREALRQSAAVMVVVSEGITDAHGRYVYEKQFAKRTDVFGNATQLSGAGQYLENILSQAIGCKTRSISLSLAQRCAVHLASACDLDESQQLGAAALKRALAGGSGELPIIRRLSDEPYRTAIETVAVSAVANREKKVPLTWLNEKRNHVNRQMIQYLYPLIQGEVTVPYKNGIPTHIRLDRQ